MTIKTKSERVERGEKTKLIVPHLFEEVTFIPPYQGPHNYRTVGRRIIARGLTNPTLLDNVFLVYGALQSNETEFKEVIKFMDDDSLPGKGSLWGNKCLWTPKGIWIQDDPEGKNEKMVESELEKQLTGTQIKKVVFNENRTLAFVPKEDGNYIPRGITPSQLSKNNLIIALGKGEQGAEKFAQLAEIYKKRGGYDPIVYLFDAQTVGKLEFKVGGGFGLVINFTSSGILEFGCAFGKL